METLEEVQAQLDQVTKLYDQEVAVKEQAQADLATAQEEKVALQAEVDEKTAELEKVNTSLKEAVTAHRVQILTLSGMDEEQVKEAETTVATMDEAQFNLLLANIKAKPATDKPKGSGGFSPGENDGDKPKLVLSKEV